MTTYFLKESNKLDNLQTVKLVKTTNTEVENKVKFNGEEYEIISEQQLKEKTNGNVYGYIEISDKENKKVKVKLEDVKASIDKKVAILSKKKSGQLIGYIAIKTNEGNTEYVGLFVGKMNILPIIIIIAIMMIIGGLFIGNSETVKNTIGRDKYNKTDFKDGDKGSGELGAEEYDFGDQPVFRIKINCTPAVVDGEMNIRIESPEKENKNYAFVVKVYTLQKVDREGNVIETYEGDGNLIYESPLVYANENISDCKIDTELEDGVYVGRAVYEIYDLDLNFISQTAAKLEITSVNN